MRRLLSLIAVAAMCAAGGLAAAQQRLSVVVLNERSEPVMSFVAREPYKPGMLPRVFEEHFRADPLAGQGRTTDART